VHHVNKNYEALAHVSGPTPEMMGNFSLFDYSPPSV